MGMVWSGVVSLKVLSQTTYLYMYILELTYIKQLEEVDRHLEAHKVYLDKYYNSGYYLVSGRKVPRTGGMIIAQFANDNEVQHAIAEDPFLVHGIATYKVTQMKPTNSSEELKSVFLQLLQGS